MRGACARRNDPAPRTCTHKRIGGRVQPDVRNRCLCGQLASGERSRGLTHRGHWCRAIRISVAAASSGLAAGARRLHGRARHRAKGAKDAAVAALRLQRRPASFALVEELTSICRHRLALGEATVRTGDDGLLDHVRLASDHVADVGCTGGITENCPLQIVGLEAMPDGKTEKIDNLVDIWSDEMCSE